jgi:hypothetical protein
LWRPVCIPHGFYPLVADLLVGALHRCPGDAESGFLLPRIMRMCGMGMIERFAKNVLRVIRQMRADGRREIGVHIIGHGGSIAFGSCNALDPETVSAQSYESNQANEDSNPRRGRSDQAIMSGVS